MKIWLKNILGLVILFFLLAYLASHWDQLKELLNFNLKQLAILYFLCLAPTLISACVVQCLANALGVKTCFWDMALLNNAALLLNYVPMKFGTLFRANYLKRHYGLAYSHFATFFLYITFLMTATAAVIGLAVLLIIYGVAGYENKILAGAFAITITASLVFLLLPLPMPKGKGRLITALRNFLSSKREVSREGKTIFVSVLLLALSFLFAATRIGIIYYSMGKSIHPAGCLVLGAIGFVALFISLTPGSLGIRELVLGFSAIVLGVPLQVGLFAAMIDRAIAISYIFAAGGGSAIWLWHKQPADFKKQQYNDTACEKQ